MVILFDDKLLIELRDEDPKEKLIELRKAVTLITTTIITSDEMKYHTGVPNAISELVQLLSELNTFQ